MGYMQAKVYGSTYIVDDEVMGERGNGDETSFRRDSQH